MSVFESKSGDWDVSRALNWQTVVWLVTVTFKSTPVLSRTLTSRVLSRVFLLVAVSDLFAVLRDASFAVLRDASFAVLVDASFAVSRTASFAVLKDASVAESRAAIFAESSARLVGRERQKTGMRYWFPLG